MTGYAIADQQIGGFITGERYKVTIDVVDGEDTLALHIGASQAGTEVLNQDISANGLYSFYFDATAVIQWLRIYSNFSPESSATVDNVSIKMIEYLPGQRTVYIEMDPDHQADGLASTADKTLARSYITYDPDTGITRQPLGLTDETLWVESIYRTEMHVVIVDLDVSTDQEAACKTDISTAVEQYFRSLRPFVDGLDPIATKVDVITKTALSRKVQEVTDFYGATVDEVKFGSNPGQYLPQYTLNQGETVKTGTLGYSAT